MSSVSCGLLRFLFFVLKINFFNFLHDSLVCCQICSGFDIPSLLKHKQHIKITIKLLSLIILDLVAAASNGPAHELDNVIQIQCEALSL